MDNGWMCFLRQPNWQGGLTNDYQTTCLLRYNSGLLDLWRTPIAHGRRLLAALCIRWAVHGLCRVPTHTRGILAHLTLL
jgi:hypothetical protein